MLPGTGRHAAYLAELGHGVIGIDESSEMLAQAAKRLPDADFRQAGLDRIPLADNAVDTIVCGLSLAHVAELAPVMAEFARVLRPGGHLVISDAHLLLSYLRPTMVRRAGHDGRPSILSEYHRPLSEYLTEALRLGFQLRFCDEPSSRRQIPSHRPAPGPLPTDMSWGLLDWCPEAAAVVHGGLPAVVILHLQLEDRPKNRAARQRPRSGQTNATAATRAPAVKAAMRPVDNFGDSQPRCRLHQSRLSNNRSTNRTPRIRATRAR